MILLLYYYYYVRFIGISNALPKTSSIKLVEIWLLVRKKMAIKHSK
jgi:hypothetical protein